MNTKTIGELRNIARDKGLHGYYRLKKADLRDLLLEQSAEEMPTPPPRRKGKEGRHALPVKIIPSPQKMDEFEKVEMKKSRRVVEGRVSRLYKWVDDYVPKPIKKVVLKAFITFKNGILGLYDGAKETLKGIVKKEAEEAEEEEDADLTPHEHERALKGAYRSFMMPGNP